MMEWELEFCGRGAANCVQRMKGFGEGFFPARRRPPEAVRFAGCPALPVQTPQRSVTLSPAMLFAGTRAERQVPKSAEACQHVCATNVVPTLQRAKSVL